MSQSNHKRKPPAFADLQAFEAFLTTPIDDHERRANDETVARFLSDLGEEFETSSVKWTLRDTSSWSAATNARTSFLNRLVDWLTRGVAFTATTVYLRALPSAVLISVPVIVGMMIYSLPVAGWLVLFGCTLALAPSDNAKTPRVSLERLSWAYPATRVAGIAVVLPTLLVAVALGAIYVLPATTVVSLSLPPILIVLALVVGMRMAAFAVHRGQWNALSLGFANYHGVQPNAAWRSNHTRSSDYPSLDKSVASMATLVGADARIVSSEMFIAMWRCVLLGIVHSRRRVFRIVAPLVRRYAPRLATNSERSYRLLQCRLYFRFGWYTRAARIARRTNEEWGQSGKRSDVLVSFEALSTFFLGRPQDAIEIIESYPDFNSNPYLILNRSFLLWQVGRDEEAMTEGRRVLGFDARCPVATMNEKFSEFMSLSASARLGVFPASADIEVIHRGFRRAAEEAELRMRYVPASLLFTLAITWIALGRPERARELFLNGIELENHDLSRIGLALLAMDNSTYFVRARYHLYKVYYGNRRDLGRREVRIAKQLIAWCHWAEVNKMSFSRDLVWWFLASDAGDGSSAPPNAILCERAQKGESTSGLWWTESLKSDLAVSMREIRHGHASGWLKEKGDEWT